jgi:tetratricopeptide (TPR) repeat protein
MNHLRDSLISAFTRSLSIADAGALLHLLTCRACAAKAIGGLGFRPPRRLPPPEPETQAYTRLFERVCRDGAAWSAERERAHAEVARLLANETLFLDFEQRVRTDASLPAWPLAWELRAAAAGLLVAEPERAERVGRLAIALAEVLARAGGETAAGYLSGAWVLLGTARRRRGDFPLAGAALAHAERYVRDSIDPDERATFCRELAELRRAEGHYEEALALFERAAGLWEDFGQTDDQAAAWIAQADLSLRLADFDKALEGYESAALLGEQGIDPTLALRAGRGTAVALFEQGLLDQADDALRAVRERHAARASARERAELTWIEARIAARRGQPERAEAQLWHAWSAFAQLGESRCSAEVALDLAELFALTADAAGPARLAAEVEALASTDDLPSPVREALLSFAAAATSGRPLLPWIAALGGFLQASRDDPSLIFQPPGASGAPGAKGGSR